MESKKPKEEKSTKDNEKKPEEGNPKETSKDKLAEEDNLFLDFLKYSLMKDDINKEEKSEQKNEKEKTSKYKPLKSYTESNFLSSSITKLQKGDDMDIMSELILLCEQLSLSSDQIGDNPNMHKLLEVFDASPYYRLNYIKKNNQLKLQSVSLISKSS